MMKFNMIIKCILIGDSEVGKSSILSQYIQKEFFLDSIATIGVDFGIKEINISRGVDDYNIKLNIWDTSGDRRFKSIVESYYRNTSYVLLVFDVNNRSSFNNVIQLHNSIKDSCMGAKFILVGNKADIDTNKVTEKEVLDVAKERNALYILTSAKENMNIHALFKCVYTHALSEFEKLPYTTKITCNSFNNIKVGIEPRPFKQNQEVNSCWCGLCNIC